MVGAMLKTALTERLGLTVPVVSAPMAGISGGALAAAVSEAGGLGMIGVGSATPVEWLRGEAGVAAASGRPYGIGLMAWALPERQDLLEAAIEARPALVSVSFGDCRSHVGALRDAGILTATQVGHVDDAREAEAAGVDLIVARGAEAGGHGRDHVGTLLLLQEVLEEVRTPVLAAGGIATGRGLAAVLAAGAEGAWVGTAFLTTREARSKAGARRRLLEAGDGDTVYTRVFDIGAGIPWPAEFGGRALRNRFSDRWHGREEALAGDEDARRELTEALRAGDEGMATIYAGQGAALLREEPTAAEVVARLGREAEEAVARLGARSG
jgi:nitronate monooxygenase